MTAPPLDRATVLKVAMAVGLVVALYGFATRIWRIRNIAPPPNLIEGLGDSRTQEAQQAFLARLRARFPPGSAEEDLLRDLRAQGFKLGAREATYDRGSGIDDVCRRGANVRWTADDKGRIGETAGGFYVYCP